MSDIHNDNKLQSGLPPAQAYAELCVPYWPERPVSLPQELEKQLDSILNNPDPERFHLEDFWQKHKSEHTVAAASHIIFKAADFIRSPAAKCPTTFRIVNECIQLVLPEIPSIKRGYLSRIVHGMGVLQVRNDELMQAVVERVCEEECDLRPDHSARLLFGFGALNYPSDELVDSLLNKIESADDFRPQHLRYYSKMISGLAVIAEDSQVARGMMVLEQIVDDIGQAELGLQDFINLYQALESRELVSTSRILAPCFKNSLIIANRRAHSPSAFSRHVASIISNQGYAVAVEEPVLGYSVDIHFVKGEQQVVVECDWSAVHYINGDTRYGLRGKDIIKNRLLQRFDYEVARISCEEWDKAPHKLEFVKERLTL